MSSPLPPAPVVISPPAASVKTEATDPVVTIKDTKLPDTVGGAPKETPAETAKRKQQWVLVAVVCFLFVVLNGIVTYLIKHQLDIENDDIAKKLLLPADRTITSGVFMSLIGATVIQTGYAIRTVMRYLFPSSNSGGES